MTHCHRFYVPQDLDSSDRIVLPDAEAHHARSVVRLRTGDRVVLFNGCGSEAFAEVLHVTPDRVQVGVRETTQRPAPAHRVALLQAWLHREESIEDIVRRGTEIGVHRFRFFRAAHSETAPRHIEKLKRIAIEVCKQCGRVWLPLFETAQHIEHAIEDLDEPLLIAVRDPNAPPLRHALSLEKTCATILVGPEGDFTTHEREQARTRGAVPVSLGATTFRSETAALVLATLVLYELGAFDNAS